MITIYLIVAMISCTDRRSLVMSCSLSWLMRSSVREVRHCFFILISNIEKQLKLLSQTHRMSMFG